MEQSLLHRAGALGPGIVEQNLLHKGLFLMSGAEDRLWNRFCSTELGPQILVELQVRRSLQRCKEA